MVHEQQMFSTVWRMIISILHSELVQNTCKHKKMAAFWVVAPCSLVEVYQRFRGPCCHHHQGDES
jgi:hypothetical protein